jgi:hypothetical protein
VETVERFADVQAAFKCRGDLMAKYPNEIYELYDDNEGALEEELIALDQDMAGHHKKRFKTMKANIRLLARVEVDLLNLNIAMGSSCKLIDKGLKAKMYAEANYHRNLQIHYQKLADDTIASEQYQRAKRYQAHFQQEDRQEEQE